MPVKQFNLVNPENSDSWHCLAETDGNELMTNVLCDVVIRNTSSGRGDHFWDNAELSLLKALHPVGIPLMKQVSVQQAIH